MINFVCLSRPTRHSSMALLYHTFRTGTHQPCIGLGAGRRHHGEPFLLPPLPSIPSSLFPLPLPFSFPPLLPFPRRSRCPIAAKRSGEVLSFPAGPCGARPPNVFWYFRSQWLGHLPLPFPSYPFLLPFPPLY